eukprot:comp5753_c0_seq1/m.1613 comp5753_c0_seq1/g.1613  ORF comp5753_c0_seq1/g.1613 comp5753_c0_seq1/m.1613 type:complete len:214 (-) comp5753_c0_seq1:478-1119(-)
MQNTTNPSKMHTPKPKPSPIYGSDGHIWKHLSLVGGGSYEGGVRPEDGKTFQGWGLLVTSTHVYAGEWANGLPSGVGVFIERFRGCRYEGEFREGRASGHGRLVFEFLNDEIGSDVVDTHYVYGRFSYGKFVPPGIFALRNRERAAKAAAAARSLASEVTCLSPKKFRAAPLTPPRASPWVTARPIMSRQPMIRANEWVVETAEHVPPLLRAF